MAASSEAASGEIATKLSQILEIFHEPLGSAQVDLAVAADASVQLTFNFRVERLRQITLNIDALKPKYKPAPEEYDRLQQKYLAVAKAKDPNAWAPYDLVHYRSDITPDIAGGTCDGQVLALAEAAFENPSLSIESLAKKLSEQNKIDEVLLFHIMTALQEADRIPLFRRVHLETPYLFPSPCSQNGWTCKNVTH